MKTMASPFLTSPAVFPAPAVLPAGKRKGPGTGKVVPGLVAARRVQLAKDQVIRLDRDSRIAGVEVERGRVWMTLTPADGDLVMDQGHAVRLSGGWPVVLQALTEVTLLIEEGGTK